jgi:hypothetical protein
MRASFRDSLVNFNAGNLRELVPLATAKERVEDNAFRQSAVDGSNAPQTMEARTAKPQNSFA